MCSYLISIMSPEKKPSDYWTEIIAAQKAKGNDPLGYDTRPGTPITTLLIDPYNSGRPWTYQWCTEYGWMQTISHEHPMVSALLTVKMYTDYCKRVFGPNFSMDGKPEAAYSTIMGGGTNIAGTHIFATNGSEDPW